MAQSIYEYWRRVRAKQSELEKEYSKQGFVWLVSVFNPDKGTTDGSVSQALFKDAAQRLVEATHVVATDEQVKAYLLGREEEGRRLAAVEIDRRRQWFSQAPVPPAAS